MARERMTEERWLAITSWPLIVASLLFLGGYSWLVITDRGGPWTAAILVVLVLTWVVFVIDYLMRLSFATDKWPWFRAHLFDLAAVVLPGLRALLLLRTFTRMKELRRTRAMALRTSIAIYGAGAAALLIYLAGLAVLDVERHAPNASIVTWGDATWWAFVTITTVGYGDFYPVTPAGRAVAAMLMAGGIATLGVVTATVSSWIIERAAGGKDDTEAATRGQVRSLSQQVSELTARLSEAPDPPGPSG